MDRSERSPDATRLILLGEIAGEIAHELRNALQVISTHAYLARQNPAASAGHVAKIEKSARLAQSIVDDVLGLARAEPLTRRACGLRETVEAARAQLLVTPPVIELPPEDLSVHAHPTLLVRIFKVLFENAAQVGSSEVTVTWRKADRVEIDVADDGPGVAADVALRLFDPLTTGRSGGTGLGLALARRIAAAHGGSLDLVPTAHGALFRLVLPL